MADQFANPRSDIGLGQIRTVTEQMGGTIGRWLRRLVVTLSERFPENPHATFNTNERLDGPNEASHHAESAPPFYGYLL
jgi:hypothetical protein